MSCNFHVTVLSSILIAIYANHDQREAALFVPDHWKVGGLVYGTMKRGWHLMVHETWVAPYGSFSR